MPIVTELVVLADGLAGVAALAQEPLDPVPTDTDIRAGWTALFVFLGMAVLTVLLMVAFVKQLRRTRTNFGVDRFGNPVDGGDEQDGSEDPDARGPGGSRRA